MNDDPSKLRELTLDTPLGQLAGLSFGPADGLPVLCIHGWMDNAASFVPLGRLLKGVQLVAIDLPGHGFSEHRHPTANYHFIDYAYTIDAALDALGWKSCHLIGHSMGGAVAVTYSAAAPERVRSLTLLDSLGPYVDSVENTASRLRRSLRKHRRGLIRPRTYPSLEAMIEARCKAAELHPESARLICQRAAKKVDGGYAWRSDPAINWVSSLVMTEQQAINLVSHVQAPVQAILASTTHRWESQAQRDQRFQAFRNARLESNDGSHHFHMDDAASIADTLQAFIRNHDHEPEPIAD